jgi:hypothetical protein
MTREVFNTLVKKQVHFLVNLHSTEGKVVWIFISFKEGDMNMSLRITSGEYSQVTHFIDNQTVIKDERHFLIKLTSPTVMCQFLYGENFELLMTTAHKWRVNPSLKCRIQQVNMFEINEINEDACQEYDILM